MHLIVRTKRLTLKNKLYMPKRTTPYSRFHTPQILYLLINILTQVLWMHYPKQLWIVHFPLEFGKGIVPLKLYRKIYIKNRINNPCYSHKFMLHCRCSDSSCLISESSSMRRLSSSQNIYNNAFPVLFIAFVL